MKKLNLNAIRIDGGTQSRVEINMEAVADYAEAVKVGIEFPAIVVFHDGADHWLADGFHRYHSHKQAGKASILADVRDGTLLDAKLYALGANGTHGLRRSNADKRKAVQMALDEPSWAAWSDRKIADACGVSQPFVSGLRKPPEVITVITPAAKNAAPKVITVITPEPPGKPATRELPAPQEPAQDEQIAEAQHTITELSDENEDLRDRLAVMSLMDTEEAKAQTNETLRELRALVKTLQAENESLKVSRDTYMREASEAKKSAIYWRKQAEKAAKDSA